MDIMKKCFELKEKNTLSDQLSFLQDNSKYFQVEADKNYTRIVMTTDFYKENKEYYDYIDEVEEILSEINLLCSDYEPKRTIDILNALNVRAEEC